MSERVEGSALAKGIQIHYSRYTPKPRKMLSLRVHGNRSPLSIVCLHGVTENGLCWERFAEALCQDYDIVLPDSRGHGFSDAPEIGYGVDDRAADVADLIRDLNLDRPVLIGHAMGAETAIGTASIYPDLVRAVVLEDPPWPGRFWGSTPEERADRARQWSADILRQKGLSKEELVEIVRKQHPDWDEEEFNAWAESKQQVSPYVANMVLA